MAKIGVGIDCIHFVSKVLIAAGGLPEFELPFYSPTWGFGKDNNLMERVYLDCTFSESYPYHMPPQNGDIVIFRAGRQSNHCGIILEGQVWHSLATRTVRAELLEHHYERIQSFIRLTAAGFKRRPETLTPDDFSNL